MAVSDIVTYGSLPEVVRNNLEAWAGCVAGALDETAYLDKMRQAGFTEVEVTARSFAEIEQWAELGELPEPVQYLDELKGQVASIKVATRKP